MDEPPMSVPTPVPPFNRAILLCAERRRYLAPTIGPLAGATSGVADV